MTIEMTISEAKSVRSILFATGTSHGLLSLVFDKFPSGIVFAFYNISAIRILSLQMSIVVVYAPCTYNKGVM